MRNGVVGLRTGECPWCKNTVPTGTIKLGGSFECPRCGKTLKVHKINGLATRLVSLVIGLIVARAMGFEGALMVGIGVVISPFLVLPVWKLSTAILPPVLVPAAPPFTTLGLGGK